MTFEQSMETGKTSSIVVKVAEYKGQVAVDVRKTYNGAPTKKGAFLAIESREHEFVAEALPLTLADSQERKKLGKGSMDLYVRRYDYKGMEGYSIHKEAKNGQWGKGIWLNPTQAKWVAEQIAAAREAL